MHDLVANVSRNVNKSRFMPWFFWLRLGGKESIGLIHVHPADLDVNGLCLSSLSTLIRLCCRVKNTVFFAKAAGVNTAGRVPRIEADNVIIGRKGEEIPLVPFF